MSYSLTLLQHFPNRHNTLPAAMPAAESEQSVSSYAQESFFRIKILSAGYINISDVDEVRCFVFIKLTTVCS